MVSAWRFAFFLACWQFLSLITTLGFHVWRVSFWTFKSTLEALGCYSSRHSRAMGVFPQKKTMCFVRRQKWVLT